MTDSKRLIAVMVHGVVTKVGHPLHAYRATEGYMVVVEKRPGYFADAITSLRQYIGETLGFDYDFDCTMVTEGPKSVVVAESARNVLG